MTQLIEYSVTDANLKELAEKYAVVPDAVTEEGYQAIKECLRETTPLRTAVEKRRKELKKDALEYGRKIDTEAKRITSALVNIETPYREAKQVVDDEASRIKREKMEAEAKSFLDKQAEEQARIAKEQAEKQAELDKQAEEQRKQQEAIEAERVEAARVMKEAQDKAEAEKRAAEQKKLAEERAEAEKVRKEKERLEAEKREAEEQQRKKEAAEAEAIRQEELRPDREKLEKWAGEIDNMVPPSVSSENAKVIVTAVLRNMAKTAKLILEKSKEL